MGVAVESDLFHSRQKFTEGRISGEVDTQRKRVDEKANQWLDLGVAASGD